jgi:hypothetical protein
VGIGDARSNDPIARRRDSAASDNPASADQADRRLEQRRPTRQAIPVMVEASNGHRRVTASNRSHAAASSSCAKVNVEVRTAASFAVADPLPRMSIGVNRCHESTPLQFYHFNVSSCRSASRSRAERHCSGYLKGEQPLDLRPLVSDITADVLAGAALTNVDASRLLPIAGEFTDLAPIESTWQIAATGFNYKKYMKSST